MDVATAHALLDNTLAQKITYRAAAAETLLHENAAFDVIIVREVKVGTGKTVLAETITLLDEGCCEASHASQEIDADTGGLGGVQLWRSVKRR